MSRSREYEMWDTPDPHPQMEKPSDLQDPVRDLAAAVIQRAIDDLAWTTFRQRFPTRNTPHPLTIGEEAFQWLFLEEGVEVCSLAWCCEVLDTTPRQVRLEAERQHTAECWVFAKTVALTVYA